MHLLAAVGVVAGVTVSSGGTASAHELLEDSIREEKIVADETVGGQGLEFGAYLHEPRLEEPVGVPGTNEVVGLLQGSQWGGQRMARLDVLTGRLRVGDVLPAHSTGQAPLVTSSGKWLYVFTSDGLGGEPSAQRFDLATLGFDRTIDLSRFVSEGVGQASAVPGRDDALIVTGRVRSAILVEDGVVAPERLGGDVTVGGVPAVDRSTAILPISVYDDDQFLVESGVYRIEISDAGLRRGAVVVPDVVDVEVVRDGEIITSSTVYDMATGEVRRGATPFDRATQDPTEPLRYWQAPAARDTVIFDSSTGEVLAASVNCRLSDRRWAPIGNGRLVQRRDVGGTLVVDALENCGSYGEFTAVDPARVFDSRTGQGAVAARPLVGRSTTRIKIHGLGGVPEHGVESVVLNVTALRQTGTGTLRNFITVRPAGFAKPTVSNLNVDEGEVVGNMVTVSTAAGGFVDVFSNRGTVDLTVDVMGYFASTLAPPGGRFVKWPTERIVDTRRELGAVSGVGSGQAMSVDAGQGGRFALDQLRWDASDVVAVVMNVTAIQPTQQSHFRIHPSGQPLPTASSMNFPSRVNTSRLVTVKAPGGRFDLWNRAGNVDVTIDLVGVYLGPDAEGVDLAGRFVGLVPVRDLDTRVASPFGGSGAVTEQASVVVTGLRPEIDLVANLTAIRPTTQGYLSAGPGGSNAVLRQTSSINFAAGAVVANQVIVKPSDSGEVGVYNNRGDTHVALDIFGFYTR